jgi:hypothetical protein
MAAGALEAKQETLVLTAKKNRHVVIALNHMNKRRDALLEKRAALTKEIEELDAGILALSGE